MSTCAKCGDAIVRIFTYEDCRCTPAPAEVAKAALIVELARRYVGHACGRGEFAATAQAFAALKTAVK